MDKKIERMRQIILEEISLIVQNEVKNNRLGFVTITDVRLNGDQSIATVYVNFLGSEEREEAGMEALEHSKGFIRTELAKRLTTRTVPELKFEIDTSLEKGNRIENIIKEINKK